MAVLLAGGLCLAGAAPPSIDDPLIQPITGQDASRWLEPQDTARVHGRTWYIGSKRLRQAVIDSGDGLVLIDAGLPEGIPAMKAQLATLGFDLHNIRAILLTEPHYDHVGGTAALIRESSARVHAAPFTKKALQNGFGHERDPQFSSLLAFPPVDRVHVLHDGATITVGRLRIKAHTMPGHTPGSMGYSWRSCEGDDCQSVVFAASLNPLATGSYRYAEHPSLVHAMRGTLARLEGMPCDILLTGHPEHSGADGRLSAALAGKPNAFTAPNACRLMVGKYRGLLVEALKR